MTGTDQTIWNEETVVNEKGIRGELVGIFGLGFIGTYWKVFLMSFSLFFFLYEISSLAVDRYLMRSFEGYGNIFMTILRVKSVDNLYSHRRC